MIEILLQKEQILMQQSLKMLLKLQNFWQNLNEDINMKTKVKETDCKKFLKKNFQN